VILDKPRRGRSKKSADADAVDAPSPRPPRVSSAKTTPPPSSTRTKRRRPGTEEDDEEDAADFVIVDSPGAPTVLYGCQLQC